MPGKDLCLLSLGKYRLSYSNESLLMTCEDGSGVRGLSTLYILQHIMEMINPDAPPKPCEYFDIIAGTSTGGFVRRRLRTSKLLTVFYKASRNHAWPSQNGRCFVYRSVLPVFR